MKISELFSKLDLSKKQPYNITGNFLSEFDLQEYDIDLDKINLYCIRLVTWYCTDTFVGVLVILLDDKPVCLSKQTGRKSDENFYWFEPDDFLKIKDLLEKAKIAWPNPNFINLESNFGDCYNIEFADQMIPEYHSFGFFKGEKVSVEKIKSDDYIERRVKITFENGNSQIVNVNEIEFPISGLRNTTIR